MTEALDQTLAAIRVDTDPVTGPHHERLAAFLERIEQLDRRPRPGETAPAFSMPGAEGGALTLGELLREGPLLLVFIRGSWCPFCSAQMHALAEAAPAFRAAGIGIAVVTPETEGRAAAMKRDLNRAFEVLCDIGEGVALTYGCLFFVPQAEQAFLCEAGYDLASLYGTDGQFMPLASAFAIDQDGRILAVYDRGPDQRRRADPHAILTDFRAALGRSRGAITGP